MSYNQLISSFLTFWRTEITSDASNLMEKHDIYTIMLFQTIF